MSKGFSLTLYNVLLPPVLLASLPGFLVKMKRRGGYGAGFAQRFGRYSGDFAPDRPVWIHAVSVGEVLIANKLVEALRAAEPDLEIVLSTTTSTGHGVATSRWSEEKGVDVIYNPIDLPWIVERALERIRPRALVLVEAEVWPNLVHRATRDNIPVLLANARLSPRSEGRYRRFHSVVSPIFEMLDCVCVQEDHDVGRWEALGVDRTKVTRTGSIKFDQDGAGTAASAMVERFRGILKRVFGTERPTAILAASTHAGEEAAIGEVFLKLRKRSPQLIFLVAPRHFERASEVERELRAIGLKPCLRSRITVSDSDEAPAESGVDTMIIDTTGELRAWQELPEIVVIGKSFLARGGQNPVEAVGAGVPVISGPHMENFEALMNLLHKHAGVIQVDGIDELEPAVLTLLEHPSKAQELTANARAALDAHSGATRNTVALILSFVKDRAAELDNI